MDGNSRLEAAWRYRGSVTVALWLGAGFALGVGGCAKPDHRLSLNEFLDVQQAWLAERQEAVEREVTVDLEQQLGPYKVGPGDVLMVTLAGTDGTGVIASVQTRIDRNGGIDLPIVGAVQVADRELEDVEDAVRQAYVPAVYKEAVCHVQLVTVDTTNVLVVGAVTEPGLVPLRRTERNMLFAIVGAGGISEIASGQATLRRIRNPAEEVTLDLTDPIQLQEALALEPLEHGDILYVHAARPNTVFVGGLVNRPSPQVYPPGTEITVLQALAAAGGLRTDVVPKEGTLIRRMPSGEDLHVKLDLNRLARGDDPNVTLAAGDILWIPDTLETRIQDFLNRNLFLRGGVSVTYSVTGIEFLNRHSLQGGRYGGGLQDTFDPLGFLGRNTLLQGLAAQPVP